MQFKSRKIGYLGRNTFRQNVTARGTSGGGYLSGGLTPSVSIITVDNSQQQPSTKATVSNAVSTTTPQNYYFASETSENDTPGHWTAVVGGVPYISDGITVKLKMNTGTFENDEGYNTLSINGMDPMLVFISDSTILTNQLNAGDEVLFTYRIDCGSYAIGEANNGELYAGTYTSGWVAGKLSFGSGSEEYLTASALKTINGESIVGEGNISVSTGGGSANIQMMTIAEYNALETKDAQTFYIII